MRTFIFLLTLVFSVGISAQSIELVPIKSGLRQPTDIAHSGIEGDNRLFIVEKTGIIQVLDQRTNELTEFLNIRSSVNAQANERGLLGLCFHPDYQNNGYFFVHYTNAQGNSVISRFKNSDNGSIGDSGSEKIILSVPHPFNNHNAGDLEFGNDGYLYIGMGDGGSGGDPQNRSQNPKTLLGKMLRIDVNTEDAPYLIPNGNPYSGQSDTLPEIWALGLRNPWRFSFDRALNDLWIADVGQQNWEEINKVSATEAGLNYGWRCYEGNARFNFGGCNDAIGYTFPIHVYPNRFDVGCSVTGGFVYRGQQETDLIGKYIYADFCTGIFWALSQEAGGMWKNETLGQFQTQEFATFGEDVAGELYVAGLGNGTIYKVKSLTSSTSKELKEENISLSPNPVTDFLTLTGLEEIETLPLGYILDISGRKIKTIDPQSLKNSSVNVSDLPSGLYFLEFENPKIERLKFIKQ